LTAYSNLLGDEVESRIVGNLPEPFAGSTAHYFLLMLWPHLYWVVHSKPDGTTWGPEFQNQANLRYRALEPSVIRPGVWTRKTLESLADSYDLHDGWDERVIVRFGIRERRYEGVFVLGLLQEWREIGDESPTAVPTR
jgi:hypothetical protein